VACTKVSVVPENSAPIPLPDFTRWPSFPFEGDMRVKPLAPPVPVEPPRSGEDAGECVACNTPDDAYIWVSERWRVRAMDRPTGLPMVLILECRSHLDLGDLPNLLAAELGVMTVRMERAIRSLDGVARVHVNRWGDGSAHLHMWFLARPYGRLQLRGTFLSPHIQWQSPSTFSVSPMVSTPADDERADVVSAAGAAFGDATAGQGDKSAGDRGKADGGDVGHHIAGRESGRSESGHGDLDQVGGDDGVTSDDRVHGSGDVKRDDSGHGPDGEVDSGDGGQGDGDDTKSGDGAGADKADGGPVVPRQGDGSRSNSVGV
jgi:hypothetical protein